MNKSRKKLLMSSMAMLLISAMALSTATFAWFTSSNTGEVTDIEFTATAAQGILLSADALNWKSTLPISEIQDSQGKTGTGEDTANFADELIPLSTTGSVAAGVMTLFNGTMNADGTMKTKAELPNGGFYRFDVYVKNDGASSQSLYLDLGASEVKDKEGNNTQISNAVRLAFIDQGDGGEDTQTQAGVLAATAGTTSVIWEPNATTHGVYAQTYRYIVDEDGETTDSQVTTDTKEQPYVGIKAAKDDLSFDKGAVTLSTGYAELVATKIGAGKEKIAELPANKVIKLTIYLWIEGQDIDCNNKESGGTVLTKLSFTTTAASSSSN